MPDWQPLAHAPINPKLLPMERLQAPRSVGGRGVIGVSLHDGWLLPVPQRFPALSQALESARRERDLGGTALLRAFCRHLDGAGAWRVRVARELMDANRFPGVTPADIRRHGDQAYLYRLAIHERYGPLLSPSDSEKILSRLYERVSDTFWNMFRCNGGGVLVDWHTYDRRGADGALRPPVSIITRVNPAMSPRVFGGLAPPALLRATAPGALKAAIAEALAALPWMGEVDTEERVYKLPAGALVTRWAVHGYYQHLQRLHASAPGAGSKSWRLMWDALLATGSRRAGRVDLLDYFTHLRPAPAAGDRDLWPRAADHWRRLHAFSREREEALSGWLADPQRPVAALALEIRKDLVLTRGGDRLDREAVDAIGQAVALGVSRWLSSGGRAQEDPRPVRKRPAAQA